MLFFSILKWAYGVLRKNKNDRPEGQKQRKIDFARPAHGVLAGRRFQQRATGQHGAVYFGLFAGYSRKCEGALHISHTRVIFKPKQLYLTTPK